MLSITGWWLVTAPTDLRCGMDRLWLQVQSTLGRYPAKGEAFVFANRPGTRIKLPCCDRYGSWLAVRHLHLGSFVWPCAGESVWALSAEQFTWLWPIRIDCSCGTAAGMDLSTLEDIHDPQALLALLTSLQTQHEVALAAISQQSDLIATCKGMISRRDTQIEVLTAEIARLRRLQFSARSERMVRLSASYLKKPWPPTSPRWRLS